MSSFDVVYSDDTYCTLCDMYFPTHASRRDHIQSSSNHPACETCDRRFLNLNSLRSHYVISAQHHYCRACEKSFNTAAGLRMHIETAAVHRDDSDDDDSEDEDYEDPHPDMPGWEDEEGALHYPEENILHAELIATGQGARMEREWEDVDDLGSDQLDLEGESEVGDWLPADSDSDDESDDEGYESDGDDGDDIASEDPFASPEDASSSNASTSSTSHSGKVKFTCPLCLAVPKVVAATHCGHCFCSPCIKRVFRDERSAYRRCPVCRETGSVKELRKIYLNTV